MTPSAGDLLATWELGHERHPLDRALLLFALALPDAPPDSLADQPLGRRNAALLRLRRALFGPRLQARVDCPGCGQRLEFDLDVARLWEPDVEPQPLVEVDGQRFRLPTTRDLAHIADSSDVDRAAEDLLRLCREDGEDDAGETPRSALVERVGEAIGSADPCAAIDMDFDCEACGHTWRTPFDVPGFLWEELDARVARLFDEVHLLAARYGWGEADILAMSDARRGAYLERVEA